MAVADRDVLIIGAGHAGAMLAVGLRQKGFTGSILMVGEEPALPYERPPLSKAYFVGAVEEQRLYLRKPEFWQERDVEIRLSTIVARLRHEDHEAELTDGTVVRYRHCVIATGGRVRKLACPGADLAGVHYLRTLADVDAIRGDLKDGARMVVIGGGYVGLEMAASARKLGYEVTLIEALDRVLARVTSPIISRFYEAQHRAHGVDVRLGTGVEALEGDDHVTGVRLTTGEVVPADLVVVGIGILPNTELARESGLACDNGVVVDELCRSTDPDVFAIGDVAKHANRYAPAPMRLESVQNAVDQAKTVVGVIMGQPEPYKDLPWFWSDQYDLKLQTAGLAIDYDETVVRGDATTAPFSVVYLRDGQIIAIDAVNAIKDFMGAKALIQAGVKPDKARLADPAVSMKELADA